MGIKIGMEIEYLLTDSTGNGIPSGWGTHQGDSPTLLGLKILQRAARNLERGATATQDSRHRNVYKFNDAGWQMLPDTFSLMETVSSPFTNLDMIRDQLWKMKDSLILAAGQENCHVSGAACPIAYKYSDFSPHQNASFNNAGMHIHFDAPEDREKIKLANIFTQIIPELVAISANSPIYDKKRQEVQSFRLKSSRLAAADQVRPWRYDPTNPLQFNNTGSRYQFVTPITNTRRTVELRGFDTPMTIDWAMAIAALVQAIATKAWRLFVTQKRDTIMSANSLYRKGNFEAALKSGLTAEFLVDPTFHQNEKAMPFIYHTPNAQANQKVDARLAVKRLLYYVEAEAYQMGLLSYLRPLYQAVKTGKNQATLQREWFEAGGYDGLFAQLSQASAAPPSCGNEASETKRHYFTVRQRPKQGSDKCVYLSTKGLQELNMPEGSTICVSGPVSSMRLEVRQEATVRGSLPLADDEVRLGRSVRDKLGVSVYDPVILDIVRRKPEVIERGGSGWFYDGGDSCLVVRKGLLSSGAGTITLGATRVESLGVSEGDRVRVTNPLTGESCTLQVKTEDEIDASAAAMMAADRKKIKVTLNGRVTIDKPDETPPRRSEYEGRILKVVKGRQGSDDQLIVWLNQAVLDELGVSAGGKVYLECDRQEQNARHEAKAATANLEKSSVGMRASARKKLGVKLGEMIRIHRYESIVEEILREFRRRGDPDLESDDDELDLSTLLID